MKRHIGISEKEALIVNQYGKERTYWLNKLSGELVKSNFPYDYANTAKNTGIFKSVSFRLPDAIFAELIELARGRHHRLHVFLMAALMGLLEKYTGNKDIIVGMPIDRQDTEGNFINTVLVIRTRLENNMNFKDLVLEVRDTVLAASENQNYPIEKLLYQLDIPQTDDDFSLFDISMLLENIHDRKYIQHIKHNIHFSFRRNADCLEGQLDYNSLLYKKCTVERIINHFKNWLQGVLFNLDTPLMDVDILSGEEKEQILVDFNNTRTSYPREKVIDELFQEQARRTPGKVAVIYESQFFTYKDLDEMSGRLAVYLVSKGIGEDVVVGVMTERSFEVILCILAILKAGGAYLPIDPRYPAERKKYIVNDSSINVLMTNCDDDEDYCVDIIDLRSPSTFICNGYATNNKSHRYNSLAYVMYTSGTTANPKGVMVEHRNVVRLVKNTNFISFEEDDRLLQTGALEFDASTFEIWGVLLNGLDLCLINKQKILAHKSLKYNVQKYCITIMWMTSPLFNQMLELDIDIFRGVETLLVGGDVLSPLHINQLRRKFPAITIINGYGPTENTTFSTTYQIGREFEKNIPIGTPIANSSAYILKTDSRLTAIGAQGELTVGGDGLSRGYLNNPELTKQKFYPNPFVSGERLYKTGDLAKYLPDGNIEFLGRVDNQLKIRGYRIEPFEIENCMLKLDFIKEAVVVPRKNEAGDKYLCAYMVSPHQVDRVQLKQILSRQLPDFMVPAYFEQVDRLPLNPNGKIDIKALPEPRIDGFYIAPRNAQEEKLVEIWADILKLEKDNIGIDDNFFDLGGHSLKSTILIARLHKEFGVKVPLDEIFLKPNVRALCQYIQGLTKDTYASIPATEEKEYYELSSAQKRLYVLQQMGTNLTHYNIPMMVELKGDVDRERLEQAFQKLLRRHEILRTTFELVNDEPVQRIHKDVEFKMNNFIPESTEHRTLSEESQDDSPAERMITGFIRPFHLSCIPLLRVGMMETAPKKYVMIVDMHHIITDGTSMGILMEDFAALYRGADLPGLRIQYKDYARWQNHRHLSGEIKRQGAYWKHEFKGEIPVLNLPYDYPRPLVQRFEGNSLSFTLSNEETGQLNIMAAREDVTLFMLMLSVFNILLAKLSGNEDIVVGTPAATRRHTDLQHVIGMFVNTLPLRNYPEGAKTFRTFLQEVRKRALEAFENQEYQWEELLENIEVKRDPARNPMFDVEFVFQNMETTVLELPGLTLQSYEHKNIKSKFDLAWNAQETEKGLAFSIVYCTRLFKKATIERFIGFFRKVISTALSAPGKKIADMEIISHREKQRILFDFNDTQTGYPRGKTIYELFEKQVNQVGEHPAAVFTNIRLDYRQLNRRVCQIAKKLRNKGVGADTIVGIMVDPSIEMVVGILAILKAGGAFLPLEPQFPRERIQYMLEDSRTFILLTQLHLTGMASTLQFNGLIISLDDRHIDFDEHSNTKSVSRSHHLAYAVYTSGTSGRPKGVLLTNQNLVNYTSWFSKAFRITGSDKTVLTSSFAFDLGYTCFFSSILNGGELHLVPKETYLFAGKLLDYIKMCCISYIKITPSLFATIISDPGFSAETCETLRLVVLGGESINVKDVEKAHSVCSHIQFVNHYGPTEATIGSVAQLIDLSRLAEYRKKTTIGCPIHNTGIYIIGRNSHTVPIGVPGELCIAGDGLARGYLNKPETTAEKFLSNSYSSNTFHKTCNFSIIYRTGDLARWLPEGKIEFLGRIDGQVKVRGYRIELQEIETQLLAYEGIKEAAAVLVDRTGAGGEGDKYICGYFVSKNDVKISELKEYLAGKLPTYMLPSYLRAVTKIPLTPNGKVDRRAFLFPEFEVTGETPAAPGNEIEKKLLKVWREVLKGGETLPLTSKQAPTIGIDANFFEIGGHSLKAAVMVAKIHRVFNVKVPLAEVFKTPTIKGLSAYIKIAAPEKYIPVEAAEQRDYYPLSSAQKGLFVHQHVEKESIAYNRPQIITMDFGYDRERLEQTFKMLIERHENFRTSFVLMGNIPVFKVHPTDEIDFKIKYNNFEERTDMKEPGLYSSPLFAESIIKNFIKPFDLSCAPLLKANVINIEENKHILIVDLHHIITDGVSNRVLTNEFKALYHSEELPRLKFQYKDYSVWQTSKHQLNVKEKQGAWWLEQFDGKIPLLNMPVDYQRSATRSIAGDYLNTIVDKELTGKLISLADKTGATLYMILLAAFYILLFKYTRQEDIVVGAPVTGRQHDDLQNIIGMFINMLALRNRPEADKTILFFLMEVKENVMAAMENQGYYFEELVAALKLQGNPGRNPLFDAVFAMQNLGTREEHRSIKEEDLMKDVQYIFELKMSRFDLLIDTVEMDNRIHILLNYSTTLFKRSTAQDILNHYTEILNQMVEDPDLRLKEVNITCDLVAIEPQQILEDEEDFGF